MLRYEVLETQLHTCVCVGECVCSYREVVKFQLHSAFFRLRFRLRLWLLIYVSIPISRRGAWCFYVSPVNWLSAWRWRVICNCIPEREREKKHTGSSEVRLSNYVARTAFISQANAANWSSNCARRWLRRLARKPFKCCTHPPHTHTWVGTIKGKLKAKDEDEFTPRQIQLTT